MFTKRDRALFNKSQREQKERRDKDSAKVKLPSPAGVLADDPLPHISVNVDADLAASGWPKRRPQKR